MTSNLKQKALRDPAYLKFLRSQPCFITGLHANESNDVVACHIGTRGRGTKSSDDETLPMLSGLHQRAHAEGEMTFFRQNMPDWLLRECLRAYARALYAEYKAGGKT